MPWPKPVTMGFHLVMTKRVIRRKDGVVMNYPIDRLLHIIDYARCGIWEYIAIKEGFVMKRPIDRHQGFADGQWQECPELCTFNRGWGHPESFKQFYDIVNQREEVQWQSANTAMH